MVGGDATAFERAQPLFQAMGRMARRIGASGAGATIKLVNNMLSAAATAAMAEAAQVIEAAGLDPAAATEILGEGAAGSRLLKAKLPKMLKRDFAPQFALELMDKDLRYFLALAQELDRVSREATHAAREVLPGARRGALQELELVEHLVAAAAHLLELLRIFLAQASLRLPHLRLPARGLRVPLVDLGFELLHVLVAVRHDSSPSKNFVAF